MAAAKTTRQYHVELTEFPGEDFLAHAAALWKEQTSARLAEAGLLNTANGKEPAECKMITDIDLGAIPELRHLQRQHARPEQVPRGGAPGAEGRGAQPVLCHRRSLPDCRACIGSVCR